jgi:hypothetical protein
LAKRDSEKYLIKEYKKKKDSLESFFIEKFKSQDSKFGIFAQLKLIIMFGIGGELVLYCLLC